MLRSRRTTSTPEQRSAPLWSSSQERFYSSRVLQSRFEFSAVSPPLLWFFIATVSEAINLFYSVSSSSSSSSSPGVSASAAPAPLRLSKQLSSFHQIVPLLSFLAGRSLLWRLSAVSPLVYLAIPTLPWLLGRLVTWLLGYRGTGEKGPRFLRRFLRN